MRYLTSSRLAGGIVALLGTIYRRRQTGTLELSNRAEAGLLHFISGELYLDLNDEAWRRALGVPENLENPETWADLEANQNHLCSHIGRQLGEWSITSYRFCEGISLMAEGLTGPFPTALVLMKTVMKTNDISELEAVLGGLDSSLVAAPRHSTSIAASLLDRDELALVYDLQKPTSLQKLLADHQDDRGELLGALVRLWAVGLIQAQREGSDPVALSSDERASIEIAREERQVPPTDEALEIWRRHFRLSTAPFSLTPDPAFLYLSKSHAEALAALKLSLLERRGLACMTGEVGTGKTTILYSLLSGLTREVETAYVHNTSLPFDQLLQSALEDFGLPASPTTRRIDLLKSLNQFLTESAERGKTVALVIDEAQNLSDDAFEELRLLLNYEEFDQKLLQILLVGQPELQVRLQSWSLRQLADRIAVRCRLGPLSPTESTQYVIHRLNAAGGSEDLFTRQALKLITKKSGGIPRRINVICHNSMLYAYAEGLTSVSHSIAAEAAREVVTAKRGRGARQFKSRESPRWLRPFRYLFDHQKVIR